ncbi:amino acid transporter [Paenibacillus turicensis]|uniref:Amino acid transporter n=1 Tax=Paenibacillus turicensis TaxID=160487 RepID=A0ABS4FRE8_9BACL|nr:hypothetical protein [Paenibacillus turicensis]MBP1905153.1 amino acid transporter [Paenibacillus turicensis]
MKKIKDERLQLQSLKNIRIIFIVQNLGIIGILAYDYFSKGMEEMRNNPLWFLFTISMIILAYLSMSISSDYERQSKNPKKSLVISLVTSGLICILIGYLVTRSEAGDIAQGIIMGGSLFICILIPVIYMYNLRTKQHED